MYLEPSVFLCIFSSLPGRSLWEAEAVDSCCVSLQFKGPGDFLVVTTLVKHHLPHLHIWCEPCRNTDAKWGNCHLSPQFKVGLLNSTWVLVKEYWINWSTNLGKRVLFLICMSVSLAWLGSFHPNNSWKNAQRVSKCFLYSQIPSKKIKKCQPN